MVPESLKAAATAAIGGGTFWTSGENFGQKFTLFCWICSFVANHARLKVFLSVKVFLSKNFITKINKLNSKAQEKSSLAGLVQKFSAVYIKIK